VRPEGGAAQKENRGEAGAPGEPAREAGGAEGRAASGRPGAFLVLQNTFLEWRRDEDRFSMSYAPDMEWKGSWGPFESDRALIGLYRSSGVTLPAAPCPGVEVLREPEKAFEGQPHIDIAELEALSGCVAAFVLRPPERSLKVHVPWCENDYQVDVGTPEGRAEYRRVIDRAAEMGCEHSLFTPANREVSRLEDNTDAWGWENVLWLGLGQKIRRGEWNPDTDQVPPSLQEVLDHAKARNVRLVAYVYPTLGFLQDPEWTRWAEGKTGGYVGCDTGVRSFQDWLVDRLVAFQKRTGVSGYSFDHWWIAYDKASSKYAQWNGCRRILEELRRRIPTSSSTGASSTSGSVRGPGSPAPTPTRPRTTSSRELRELPDLHFDRVSRTGSAGPPTGTGSSSSARSICFPAT